MTPAPTVCAVVVTHERRELLGQCLAAVAAQERAPDHVLVVDNASTDGTLELLRAQHPDVELLALEENRGSAGGFAAGIEHAAAGGGFDWLWLMDDDTIPAPGALAALLAVPARLPEDRAPWLLSSKVVWSDGSLHPMNAPGPDRRDPAAAMDAAALGLLALRSTTFVSLLVSRRAVAVHGTPRPGFFIWSDDLEYTGRILRRAPGYLVPDSIVEHRTPRAHTAVSEAGERFYFHARNTLYMLRGDAWEPDEKVGLLHVLLTTSWQFLRRNRFTPSSLAVLGRAARDGLRRRIPA